MELFGKLLTMIELNLNDFLNQRAFSSNPSYGFIKVGNRYYPPVLTLTYKVQ